MPTNSVCTWWQMRKGDIFHRHNPAARLIKSSGSASLSHPPLSTDSTIPCYIHSGPLPRRCPRRPRTPLLLVLPLRLFFSFGFPLPAPGVSFDRPSVDKRYPPGIEVGGQVLLRALHPGVLDQRMGGGQLHSLRQNRAGYRRRQRKCAATGRRGRV